MIRRRPRRRKKGKGMVFQKGYKNPENDEIVSGPVLSRCDDRCLFFLSYFHNMWYHVWQIILYFDNLQKK